MKGRIAAWAMAVLLALYLVLVADRSVRLVATGEPVAIGLGVALIVLPLIAAWALMRELLFGIRTERLVRELEAEDGLPEDELPKRPSGRPDRAAADAEFDRYRAEVDAEPESWRAWFRLGLAYDASGDRRRARAALRRAIALNRQAA
jgi:tetratricopeptide (TPR) repeat protein